MNQDINDIEAIVKDAIDQKEREVCTDIIVLGTAAIILNFAFGVFVTFIVFAVTLVVLLAIKLALRITGKVKARRAARA